MEFGINERENFAVGKGSVLQQESPLVRRTTSNIEKRGGMERR